jgi:hypothetical protein
MVDLRRPAPEDFRKAGPTEHACHFACEQARRKHEPPGIAVG